MAGSQLDYKKDKPGNFIRYIQKKLKKFARHEPSQDLPHDEAKRFPWIGIIMGIGLMGGALYLLSR